MMCISIENNETSSRLRTRYVSPIIQVGLPLSDVVFVPLVRSKRAPRHRPDESELKREVSGPALKSSGLIVHNCPPPKDKDTEIDVLQAERRQEVSGDEEVK